MARIMKTRLPQARSITTTDVVIAIDLPDDALNASYRASPMLKSGLRLCLDNSQSKATLETNTDVNRFVVRPMTRVVANPFTAGVPKKNRKTQETTVVT